ncbi:hypothetical protein Bealeia1_01177 [Candidatus Bealeia paramacronuclearis]|uniref:F-box domain-containing protein n=2 Tax=Candidatus Bealeia paramacronuclearis TaxID=1921001 RepID=A0ABZ2C411_9PROT|nr:hypothetical protein [Candidatus Bealeia paramacronuclearis]
MLNKNLTLSLAFLASLSFSSAQAMMEDSNKAPDTAISTAAPVKKTSLDDLPTELIQGVAIFLAQNPDSHEATKDILSLALTAKKFKNTIYNCDKVWQILSKTGNGFAEISKTLQQPLRTFWISHLRNPILLVLQDNMGQNNVKLSVEFHYGDSIGFDKVSFQNQYAKEEFPNISSQNSQLHLLRKSDFLVAFQNMSNKSFDDAVKTIKIDCIRFRLLSEPNVNSCSNSNYVVKKGESKKESVNTRISLPYSKIVLEPGKSYFKAIFCTGEEKGRLLTKEEKENLVSKNPGIALNDLEGYRVADIIQQVTYEDYLK